MTITTCPRCGRANRSGAAFCAGCGQHLAPVVGRPALPSSADLKRYARQIGLALGWLGEQARQEAAGWYHDLVVRQPEVIGEIVAGPSATTVTQTTQFHVLFLPAGGQTTQLPALSFQVRPHGRSQDQAVLMIGARQGDLLYAGDKVRAWGVWDRDLAALRAWRVEVYERSGQPASYVAATMRPWPLAVISVALLGCLLLSCLCSLLTR